MSIKIDVDSVQGNMQAPPDAAAKFDFTTYVVMHISKPSASQYYSSCAFCLCFRISSKIPNIGGVVTTLRTQIRPWSVFFQLQNFKTVANVHRLSNRLLRNFAHFQSNYAIISFVLMLYCL